jgi:hypothetical protein
MHYSIIVVIIILILLYWSYSKSSASKGLNNIIHILTRQASRWSTAAEQDTNPLIAVLHANYGAGYLWALQDIATDQEIYDATNINFKEFTAAITNVQDKVTKKLASICPNYAPPLTYLTKIAGE